MGSGLVAAVAALLALVFVEGFAAQYPTRQTWYRLRRARGREAIRRMRERFEAASKRRSPRILALVFLVLVGIWAVVATSLFDKDWYEVVLDSLSSVIVAVALLRTPRAMRCAAERMKDHERSAGEDPDAELSDDGGPTAVVL